MQVLLASGQRGRRDVYQDIISKKTADFFGAAALVGSEAAYDGDTTSPKQLERRELFRRFGWNFGMAFQMIDDILDFTASEDNLGKPVFQDVVDGKVTLPAILLLESGNHGADNIRKILSERKLTPDFRAALAEDLARHDIIPRSIREAETYAAEAKEILNTLFGPTPQFGVPPTSLSSLCDYILLQRGLPQPTFTP